MNLQKAQIIARFKAIFALTCLLAACSRELSSPRSSGAENEQLSLHPNVIAQLEKFDLKKESPKAELPPTQEALLMTLDCRGKACPENLGLVQIRTQNSYRVCSGILIEEKAFLTTSSCMMPEFKGSTRSCSNVHVHFAQSSDPARISERIECAEISGMSFSPEKGLRPEWAVIKLRRAPRRNPLPFSPEGLTNNKNFRVAYMKVLGSDGVAFRGELNVLENCRVAQRSLILPSFQSANNSLGLLAGCDLSAAEAQGALVFDSQNRAVALVQKSLGATVDLNDPEQLATLAEERKRVKADAFALVSNLQCLSRPENRTFEQFQNCSMPMELAAAKDVLLKDVLDPIDEAQSDAELQKLIASWSPLHIPFGWRAQAIGKLDTEQWHRLMAPVLNCSVNDKLARDSAEENRVDPVRIPVYQKLYRLNSAYQVKPWLVHEPVSHNEIQLSYSPKELVQALDLGSGSQRSVEVEISMASSTGKILKSRRVLYPCR